MDIEFTKLPQSIEAEQNVLGSIFLDNKNINDIVEILKKDDFYVGSHKIIFEVIQQFFSKDWPIETVSIAEELKQNNKLDVVGGISYLIQLEDSVISSANVLHYAKIVKDKSTRRQLIKAGNELVTTAFDETIDTKGIADEAEEKIYSTCNENAKDMVSISECVNLALRKIENNYSSGGKLLGHSTGFMSIDKTTSGLQKSDFILIAARPSMGKTAFALNIAQYASKSAKTAIFSLEMSKEQLMDRMIACRCLIEFNRVRTGKLADSEWEKIAQGSAVLSNRNISIDDTAGITVNEIKAKCKKLKMQKGLDVIIIDYLQLIEQENHKLSREQEIAKISRELKKLAKDLSITVIALSQLSRAPEQRADHRPMLSDLRESGSIEQDADIVMFLYRDEYYNMETEDKGLAEVITAKNRNGEVRTDKLAWVGQYQRFGELDVINR